MSEEVKPAIGINDEVMPRAGDEFRDMTKSLIIGGFFALDGGVFREVTGVYTPVDTRRIVMEIEGLGEVLLEDLQKGKESRYHGYFFREDGQETESYAASGLLTLPKDQLVNRETTATRFY